MQAVIFAAGRGTRMAPLTLATPKPLILIEGKPILARIIENLPKEIDEVIIVVGYLAEQVMEYFGSEYDGRRIVYATQPGLGGTAHALESVRHLLRNRFLVLYADDLHGKEGLEKVISHELAMLAAESEVPERFGVLELRVDGFLKRIVEKPENPPSRLVNTGGFVLDERIFNYEAPLQGNGERYIVDMVSGLAREADVAVEIQPFWIPIGYPEDIARAEKALRDL